MMKAFNQNVSGIADTSQQQKIVASRVDRYPWLESQRRKSDEWLLMDSDRAKEDGNPASDGRRDLSPMEATCN